MSDRASINRVIAGLFARGDLDDGRADRWNGLCEHGLAHPFQSGAERWSEAALILDIASAFAPGVPLAENIVSSYLLRATAPSPELRRVTWADPCTSALVLEAGAVSGRAALVPHAAVSSGLLCEVTSGEDALLVLMEMRGVEAHAGANAAGEPRDDLVIDRAPSTVVLRLTSAPGPLFFMAALARATQMASLGEAVLSMSLEHARTRAQFGQPIARFQAVQHALAGLGCQVAAARCSVGVASAAVDRVGPEVLDQPARMAISAAKLQAGRLAEEAITVGHAVHAAMGFSREHRLHRFTRRLMSYRAELGHERVHARLLGERIRSRGPDSLWDDLVRGGV